MKLIKQISLCVIVVGAGILFIPIGASACTCDLPFPVKTVKQQVVEARKQSKAVFSGEVVEVIADLMGAPEIADNLARCTMTMTEMESSRAVRRERHS